MANTIVSTSSDDNYGFSLEWIAEGSGIGEEICGVVGVSSPIIPKIENCDTDYIEIQLPEEEVIAAQWDETDPVEELEVGSLAHDVPELNGDVLVPLDEEQDEYSRLHPYPCDFCSRRFSKQATLTVHMLTHQQRLHGCNICDATFRRKLELVEHMKIHSFPPAESEANDELSELCFVDDRKHLKVKKKKKKKANPMKTPDALTQSDMDFINCLSDIKSEFDDEQYVEDQEIKFPVIDPSRPYVCQFCGVGFAREKALVSHKMIHAGDRSVECEYCNEIFQSIAMLQHHIGSKHSKTAVKKANNTCIQKKSSKESSYDPFSCQLCHLIFSSLEGLLSHRENHDIDSGIHTCGICRRDYVLLEDLKIHLKDDHTQTNACSQCDLIFKDKYTLTRHLMTHYTTARKKTMLPCNVCGKKFSNKVTLKRHAATHETKDKSTTSVLCTECGASNFADGKSLLYHRQLEHGINIARLFPCIECGKTFNSRSSQQIHIRIHTGERPYSCKYCWKAFGDGGTLRKHERIHTGEKPYVCPVCSKAFNQRVVLREHVRAHHSGKAKSTEDCFRCMVCNMYVDSSEELCAHLVQHSDENTAKHRMPSVRKTTSPKKKKVEKPPSPYPAMAMLPEHNITIPHSPKKESPPAAKKKSAKSIKQDKLDAIVKLGKTTLENMSSMAKGKRARIVRSGKKGFNKGQNKRYLNKKEKGKTTKSLNNGSYASKYVVSQPGVESSGSGMEYMDDVVYEDNDAFNDDLLNYDDDLANDGESDSCVRTRPRTKNVSYHNMRTDHKMYDLATFDDIVVDDAHMPSLDLPSPKKRRACKKKKKLKGKTGRSPVAGGSGDSQYINGISIDSSMMEKEELIETTIVSDDLEIKQDDTTTCDMCNQDFFNGDDFIRHLQTHF